MAAVCTLKGLRLLRLEDCLVEDGVLDVLDAPDSGRRVALEWLPYLDGPFGPIRRMLGIQPR